MFERSKRHLVLLSDMVPIVLLSPAFRRGSARTQMISPTNCPEATLHIRSYSLNYLQSHIGWLFLSVLLSLAFGRGTRASPQMMRATNPPVSGPRMVLIFAQSFAVPHVVVPWRPGFPCVSERKRWSPHDARYLSALEWISSDPHLVTYSRVNHLQSHMG